MANSFVLIHGAGHGSWCWYKVIARLEAAGHRVIAPDLPGLGVDRSPMTASTLEGYALRTCEVLEQLDEPAILVGHSMGGLVISQAAERLSDRIASLVYLCAHMLPDGESLMSHAERFPEDVVDMSILPLHTDEKTGVTSSLFSDIPQWQEMFYARCSTEDRALAQCNLVAQNLEPFQAPVQVSEKNFGSVERFYIQGLEDWALPVKLQRNMCEEMPCKQVWTLDSDHSPFFSRPQELVQILLEIAAKSP